MIINFQNFEIIRAKTLKAQKKAKQKDGIMVSLVRKTKGNSCMDNPPIEKKKKKNPSETHMDTNTRNIYFPKSKHPKSTNTSEINVENIQLNN